MVAIFARRENPKLFFSDHGGGGGSEATHPSTSTYLRTFLMRC